MADPKKLAPKLVLQPKRSGSNVSFLSSLGAMTDASASVFDFQKKGFLHVKKFRKDALHRGGFSRAYWFVLKDSFLIWYRSVPANNFDIYPAGCIPLGGCSIYGPWEDEKSGGYIFEIAHKAFNGYSLVLRTETTDTEGVVAQGWISAIEESKVATWENCVYGDIQLMQYESRSRQKDKENEKLLKKLEKAARDAAIAANEKILLMEKKLEEDRRLKKKLKKLKKEREQMTLKLDTLKKEIHLKELLSKDSKQRELVANKDVIRAMDLIKEEIAKLTPRLREKVENGFVQLKEFVDDFTPQDEVPELDFDEI